MLNTYIQNQGMTQTTVHHGHKNHVNQVNWNADYDGKNANISLSTNNDGKRKCYNIILDNKDIASLLNLPSVNQPIEERLEFDFREPISEPRKFYIEMPEPPSISTPSSIQELFSNRLSSPRSNEEFIVPITINGSTPSRFTITPRRRHMRYKTHTTHKAYRKRKTTSRHSTRQHSLKRRSTNRYVTSKTKTKTRSSSRLG